MIYSIRYSRFPGLPATRQKLLFTEEQTRIKHAQKFSMYHSLSNMPTYSWIFELRIGKQEKLPSNLI
ncbi:hypothetical protein T05_4588 [Trichinella murrelli]|uniref:Uncharacterized protein n=1 Tax=Trichinella murrelli TaxID=144512 RepID=A0A0V0T3B6_9BILA|nr:hypothetical protein T05_4588 [Trichinella murrelli]